MSASIKKENAHIHAEHVFRRFSLSQRWEHLVLLLSFMILFLTGLPQKFRATSWSQYLLSTPDRVKAVQTIHHIAAVVLILEVLYHLGKAISLLVRRKLPGIFFPLERTLKMPGRWLNFFCF